MNNKSPFELLRCKRPILLPIREGMGTVESIDWSAMPATSLMPEPPPGPYYHRDAWHPLPSADRQWIWGFYDFVGEPTLSYVEWLHNKNTPAATQDKGTWTSTVLAYQNLPLWWAVESIIFGHIPCIHKVIDNWVFQVYQRNINQSDDQLFSDALFKLLKIVPSLREAGQKHGWSDWDSPNHIGSYLGASVKRQFFQDLHKRVAVHDATLVYLANRPRPKPLPELTIAAVGDLNIYLAARPGAKNRKKCKENQPKDKEEEERDIRRPLPPPSLVGWQFAASTFYDDLTPDKILEMKEEAARPKRTFWEEFDYICKDIYDRLLLTMKREGILNETEMGELYGMGRDAVNHRLARLHIALQDVLGYNTAVCAARCERDNTRKETKRCAKKPEKRKLAEEVVASWRCPKPVVPSVVPPPHFSLCPTVVALPASIPMDLVNG